MKRKTTRKPANRPDVAPRPVEYDFSKGVRGKYAARYWETVAQARTKRRRKKPA